MTDKMKKVLSQASSFGAPASMNINEIREASKKGWIKNGGCKQNSTTVRYYITDEGAAALAA